LRLLKSDGFVAPVPSCVPTGAGEKVIVEKTKMEKKDDKPPYLTEREFISFIGPDYAERFAKAFRNAVILCGGKKSAF
jgi:hypothetical protein